MGKKIKKITIDRAKEALQQDLERYKEKAIELGATNAKIVGTDEIWVDDRVVLKCQIPRCFGYGTSAHCPPNTLKPSELREYLKQYEWAVFFVKDVPSEVIVRDKTTIKERVAVYQEVFKIVNKLNPWPSMTATIWLSALVPVLVGPPFADWKKIAGHWKGEGAGFH
jgi:hypothetical protein